MQLKDQVAVIIGAGQKPGPTVGNGRAAALRFCEEGAKVLAVDRDYESAVGTAELAAGFEGQCVPFQADVCKEADMAAAIHKAKELWGRVDVLHYNVGISFAGGDADPLTITEEAFDLIFTVNLRGAVMACKHALPIMREQKSGCIIMISSTSAYVKYPFVTYKASKAAMIEYTKQLAIQNGEFGIRANVILPGLMNTPMAIDTRMEVYGESREQVVSKRDATVPLRGKMGSGLDVANAAVFLASPNAGFITGAVLAVDGAELLK